MYRALLPLLLCLTPAAAHAEWREVSSKHFLVYGEGGESSLRETAARLEKFDYLLRTAAGRQDLVEPMKIKVYIVEGMAGVQAMYPGGVTGVAGFYTADVRGPIAVNPRQDIGGDFGLQASVVLFHELSHHFMLQYFPGTYPAWYIEGFADYYGTVDIDGNRIRLGRPVVNRYFSLRGMDWLPMEKLLTATNYDDVASRLDLLYAEGWLLVHYLANSKERAGQLEKYLGAVARGQGYEAAARDAFGADLGDLDTELRRYSRRNNLPVLTLDFKPIDVGPIAVRKLSPAEDALIEYDIRLGAGVLKTDIARFTEQLASAASRFANDPYALRLLTEAHRRAGNTEAARLTSDRWLAAQPDDALAMAFKGLLLTDALSAARSTDKSAWNAARQYIVAAKAKAPRHPQILKAFYDSYAAEGVLPPPAAQNALVTALDIVPQDDALRYQVAADYEKRGLVEDAIFIIRPLAYSLADDADKTPEQKAKRERKEEKERLAGHQKTERARDMLARLEAKLGKARAAAQ